MNQINRLLQPKTDCSCGRVHECPINSVVIGNNAIDELNRLTCDFKKIVLVSDENTYPLCGEKVSRLLSGKLSENLVFECGGKVLVPDESAISVLDEKVGDSTDLIIGIGSGVINDLCKYVSFNHDIPYYIIATAPSMDGYASVGAALILNGMKITLNARPPKAILADSNILKNAPVQMLKAGYGDIIGKFSCLNDWKLSSLINNEYFCQYVYDLTYVTAKQVEGLAQGILSRDEKAVADLMEALVTVGIAMSYVGNSRPASGSEHHLSHFFEITGILDNTDYYPHGIDVAYSSVVTACLREMILNSSPSLQNYDRKDWLDNICRIYKSAADGVISLQDKLGWYQQDCGDKVSADWNEITSVLRQAPTAQRVLDLLEQIDLNFNEFKEFYGKQKISDAVKYAKDLKDRYTVLWLFDRYFKFECNELAFLPGNSVTK